MNKLTNTLLRVGQIEDWANQDSLIHHLNPLLKILLTLTYIVFVISTHYTDIFALMTYGALLIICIIMSRLSLKSLLKCSLIGLPISLCIGLSNMIFMKGSIDCFGIMISAGFLSLISLIIKNMFCLLAVFLLIGTTKFDSIACELVHIKVPSLFVMQLLMVYRYIFLLSDEARQMSQSYLLKNPKKNAIEMKDFGNFIGSLLVRSMKRSEDVYLSMKCRGFDVHKTYQHYVHFELENYFLLMMFLGVLILVKVVLS